MIDCTWLYLCDFSSFKAAHAGKYAYAWQKCSLVRWANIDCNCNIFTGKWTRGVDYLEWTRPLDVNVVLVDTIEKALFEKAVFEMFKMTRSCHVSLIEIIVHNGGPFFIIKGSLPSCLAQLHMLRPVSRNASKLLFLCITHCTTVCTPVIIICSCIKLRPLNPLPHLKKKLYPHPTPNDTSPDPLNHRPSQSILLLYHSSTEMNRITKRNCTKGSGRRVSRGCQSKHFNHFLWKVINKNRLLCVFSSTCFFKTWYLLKYL